MRFVPYTLSLVLHLSLLLAMLYWPDSKPLIMPANIVQISLVDGSRGGGEAPSPVLGPQGKRADIVAPSMPAPMDSKASLPIPLNKVPLEQPNKQMIKPEQKLDPVVAEKAKAEAEAKIKAEAEAKALAEAKIKVEIEAKVKAEAKIKAEAEAKVKVEAEAKVKVEAEAKALAERKDKALKKAKLIEEQRIKARAKAAADKKAKVLADKNAKALAERKAKAKAKAEADKKAKALAERKAKANPINKALAEARAASSKEKLPQKGTAIERALAEAKRNAGGYEGGGGGQGSGEGGGGLKDIYIGQVMLAVRPNWGFASNSRTNLVCSVRVNIDAQGNVLSAVIVNSSGNSLFDASSVNAIKKTGAEGNFPIPPTSEYQDLILSFNLREMGY